MRWSVEAAASVMVVLNSMVEEMTAVSNPDSPPVAEKVPKSISVKPET